MSEPFSSLIALCRKATSPMLQDSGITLQLLASPEVAELIAKVAHWRDPEVYANGAQQFAGVADVSPGTAIEVRFHNMGGNDRVIVQNMTALLAFQGGLFQSAPPAEYYLLDEDYAAGEPTVQESVAGFLRMPALLNLLRSLSDAIVHSCGFEELVLLARKRIVVPVRYDAAILASVPDEAAIRAIELTLQSPPHETEKRALLKAALQRLIENVAELKRFSHLTANFSAWRANFDADFELFSTEFNFEKTREDFERKRFDYLLKCNGIATDVLTKLLAIPVGQGLLASQMKTTPESAMANLALLVGGIFFFVIGLVILMHHRDSLTQLLLEFDAECEGIRKSFPDTYKRLASSMASTKKRIVRSRRWIPVIMLALLIVSLLFDWATFRASAPWVVKGI